MVIETQWIWSQQMQQWKCLYKKCEYFYKNINIIRNNGDVLWKIIITLLNSKRVSLTKICGFGVEFFNALITLDTLELVLDLACQDSKDVRDAGDFKHFADLWELLNVDVVESNLAIMLGHCFLHQRLESYARTAPGSWALKHYWVLCINDLIPLFNFSHRFTQFWLFIWFVVVSGELNSFDTIKIDFTGWRGPRDKLFIHCILLLLHNESTHLCSDYRLALRLTNEILKKSLLNVHDFIESTES